MTIVALQPAAEKDAVLRRARRVASYYHGGTVDSLTAVTVLIDRLDELERKLARIAVALNGGGRRAA